MMFPQDRKYFRFRFSRVLALAFLLSSSPQAASVPNSCAEVETTLITSLTDEYHPEFVDNFVDCLDKMKEQKHWEKIQDAADVIQKLPLLMEKALLVARKGGLVVLSAYLLYRSFELYDRAMNLARDYKMHRHEFESLQEEIIPLRDYMETQLIPQWKKGNIANMQMITGKLLEKLSHYSTVLGELTKVIHQDAKENESNKRWTVIYGGAGAIAVCSCSFYVGNRPLLIMFICGFSFVTISWWVSESYYSIDDTVTKLDMLWEDTTKMSKEIRKYRSQFEITKIGEFEVLLTNSTQ